MTSLILLQAAHLTHARQNHCLFNNLSFALYAHDLLLIEGENGSGKTTLLKILAGLITPCAGEIKWHNQNIYSHRENYLANLHFIGHQSGIKPGLTALENIMLLCHYHAISPLSRDNIETILKKLSLHHLKNTLAGKLSAGQRRRLALAKLWLIPKKLWVLDEPLTALDIASQSLLISHLRSHLEAGGMAILTSHQSILLDYKMKKLRLA